jgi:hypothetical protein
MNNSNLMHLFAANVDWPKRSKIDGRYDRLDQTYQEILNSYVNAGWIHGHPILVYWDDWDLNLNDWFQETPYFFINHEVTKATKRYIDILSTHTNSAPFKRYCADDDPFKGVSWILYRFLGGRFAFDISASSSPSCVIENDIVRLSVSPLSEISGSGIQINSNAKAPEIIHLRADPYWQKKGTSPCTNIAYSDHESLHKNIIDQLIKNLFLDDVSEALKTSLTKRLVFFSSLFFACIPEVKHTYFIPGYGFQHKKRVGTSSGVVIKNVPETSGGVVIWSMDDDVCIQNIRTAETFRCLRTSIEDWGARRAREVRQKAIQSARAAIMSRNLSHNVGSHSLANSRFFEAVGVLDQFDGAPGAGANHYPLMIQHPTPKPNSEPDEDGNIQFEMETVGELLTPVLTPGPVQQGEAWRARNRLGAMNSYLQGRMDFIARAIGETTSQPEPMFFVNDLLMGFLSQSVLLNTLLSDNGYTAPQIDFVVTLDSGTRTFTGTAKDHHIRHADFKKGGTFDDVLVAVPGGMVGRHAFYAFLENFMRNAAKYRNRAKTDAEIAEQSRFRINLTLRKCPPEQGACFADVDVAVSKQRHACYVLMIHDNLSEDTDGAVNKVREYLNEPIIDNDDKPRSEGHGIQEMKVCAQFLAGGESGALVFPKDENLPDDGGCLGKSYLEFAQRENVRKITEENSLVCHPYPLIEDVSPAKHMLAYSLLIQQPCLLGIVTYEKGPSIRVEIARNEPTVAFYDSIATLSENPAYFGLIKIQPERVKDALAEIAKYHTALPYRLMLVVDEKQPNNVAKLQTEVDDWQKANAANWFKAFVPGEAKIPEQYFPLPVRRVRVIGCSELFEISHDHPSDKLQKLTLTVYDKWLEAFKGAELRRRAETSSANCDKWNLAIGFQRSKDAVLKKWNLGENGKIDLGFNSTQIELYLFFNPSLNAAEGNGCNCAHGGMLGEIALESSDLRVTLLALDNHGECGLGLEKDKGYGESSAIPVYHPFSGSQQVDLFQLLDSPPSDRISRAFLIYSVAEALLTKVVIVDERVADASVDEADDVPKAFGKKLRAMQRTGMFPLYAIKTRRDAEPHPLSDTAKTAVANVPAIHHGEGLYVCGTDSNGYSAPVIKTTTLDYRKYRDISLSSDEYSPDFIVIHEGVTDALKKKELWALGDHQPLYAICPAVVRTSGRGSISRFLGEELPFYEFSELSEATYRQMNKVTLSRGLLSLRGRKPKVKGK